MDTENKPGEQGERRDWRQDRRQWREDRRQKWADGKFGHDRWDNRYHSGNGHIWTGFFLLIIGGVALLKAMLFPLPDWLFTWQMLLVTIGLFLGVRHRFHGGSWFILMIIGGAFLLEEYFPQFMLRQYLWPAALMILGLFFILRPRKRHWKEIVDEKIQPKIEEVKQEYGSRIEVGRQEYGSSEDFIDSTSIFGGVKKNILSKNFKGGDITNIMGGSEIDLSQADINGTARIDLTQIFGGTKLIVPSNWMVKPQMAAIFGGIEDKRSLQNATLDPTKILVLDGTSIFGGIEIRSY